MTPTQFYGWLKKISAIIDDSPDDGEWSIIRMTIDQVETTVPEADQWPEDILNKSWSIPKKPMDINKLEGLDDLLC